MLEYWGLNEKRFLFRWPIGNPRMQHHAMQYNWRMAMTLSRNDFIAFGMQLVYNLCSHKTPFLRPALYCLRHAASCCMS